MGAVLRTEADIQFKELRKATDSEALVKEAKIEEMRARDKDAITAGFQAETDRLHAVRALPTDTLWVGAVFAASDQWQVAGCRHGRQHCKQRMSSTSSLWMLKMAPLRR